MKALLDLDMAGKDMNRLLWMMTLRPGTKVQGSKAAVVKVSLKVE